MKTIDNFYKEINEAFNVDNTHVDKHWQQMQQQIIAQKYKTKHTKLSIAIATVVIALVLCIVYFNLKKKNDIAQLPTKTIDAPITNNENKINTPTTLPNTVAKQQAVATNTNKTSKNIASDIIDQTSFYIDLSKQPELFTIDASIVNTVVSKAGSTIVIPANTLQINNQQVNGNVTMTLQEYYKTGTNAAMLKYHFYQNDTLLTVSNASAIEVKLPKQNAAIKQVVFYNQNDNIADGLLQQMQWASTERFITENNNKLDYKITLPVGYSAKTFISLLAFTNQKVLVPGDVINNSIIFKNIPKGENVYFISLGKVNGKYFICNKKLTTTTNEIKDLNFLETSEGFYIKKFEELSALSKGS